MKRWTLIALALLIAAGAWLAGATMGPYAMSKEPRFPQLTMEQLSEGQKPLARADHESVQRRPRRTVQSAAAQPGARPAHIRSVPLSALGDVGAAAAQRVRDPDRRPAVALASRMVRARAARHQGRACARHRRRPQGQQAVGQHAAGRGRSVRLRHRAHDQSTKCRTRPSIARNGCSASSRSSTSPPSPVATCRSP